MLSLSSPHLHGLLRDTVRETGHLVGCGIVSMLNTKELTLKYFCLTANKSAGLKIGLQIVKLLMSTCHHQNNKRFLKGCSS